MYGCTAAGTGAGADRPRGGVPAAAVGGGGGLCVLLFEWKGAAVACNSEFVVCISMQLFTALPAGWRVGGVVGRRRVF